MSEFQTTESPDSASRCPICCGDGWLTNWEYDECQECLGTGERKTRLWVAERLLERRENELRAAQRVVAKARAAVAAAHRKVENEVKEQIKMELRRG